MTVDVLKNMMSNLPSGRLLGLDIGKKTIGLAVSDAGHSIATPLKTIHRTKFTKDILELEAVIKDYEIEGYILGYPLNMDGSEGPRCEATRHFGQEMENHPDIFGQNPWIALWDERLSTATVDDFLVNTVDMSRSRRKEVIDKLAAQVILQGALDFIVRET